MVSRRRRFAFGLAALVLLGGAIAAEVERRPRYARRLDPPMRDEAFRKPRCVTADLATGEVFVCDMLDNRILIFDQLGVFRYQITGGTNFHGPMDVAVDPDGFLFVSGYHNGALSIVRLDFDGLFLGVLEFSGLPDLELPLHPMSLALSPEGDRLYVVDSANHLLIVSDRDGRVENAVDLVAGMEPEDAQAQLYAHVDAYGDTVLLARPTLGVVHRFALDGSKIGQAGRFGTGNCHTAFPMAAALDEEGHVLILDQRRMLFTTWDPESNRCLDEFYGMGGHPGGLYAPEDMALDAKGRVYISQTFEGRVQVYEGGWPAAGPAEAPAD